jgi:hypothetical protein
MSNGKATAGTRVEIVKLNEDIYIEAEIRPGSVRQLGSFDKIGASVDDFVHALGTVAVKFSQGLAEIKNAVSVEKVELEMGLKLSGEGKVFITKASAEASITVKIVLKPGGAVTARKGG